MPRGTSPWILALCLLNPLRCGANPPPPDTPGAVIEVDRVWAGHRVGFCLLTRGDRQFVGYYDAERRMVIAGRTLGETSWTKQPLDSVVGWDSHNYLQIAIDAEGYLHVCGNMHVKPLVYFRSTRPLDVATLEPVHRMTGEREGRATYPRFFTGPGGVLLFGYRDGSSGSGDTLFNRYDPVAKTWHRLLETPLLDGLGKMNAYPLGPDPGPDGCYHMSWVWRDTPAAETNHDLCHARSRDLLHWETAGGEPLQLPLTPETPGVTVDPIPPEGGILNGSGKVGFDAEHNVVIAYHKFDDAGNTQLYFARWEDGAWKIRQATDWDYRWDFRGGGTLPRGIGHGALETRHGQSLISIQHPTFPGGTYKVDPETWKLTERIPNPPNPVPEALRRVESGFPGMAVNWQDDSGVPPAGVRYRLRWETLPANRDKPREKPWPEPSLLRLLALPATETTSTQAP